MQAIVQRGAVLAVPELGHSVHVEVQGLDSSRWYWYQFSVGSDDSPIGRTRTALAPGSTESLQFAFVSCQHYAQGRYHAHTHLAEEDLDFGVHLGDYIYEGRATSAVGRPHLPDVEITSIEDYRIRYGLYKSDPSLQAVPAAFPWIVTWDDHETENDYAGLAPENPNDPADNQPDFASRRARAYQPGRRTGGDRVCRDLDQQWRRSNAQHSVRWKRQQSTLAVLRQPSRLCPVQR
jgi:alkaline phosphatase D